MRTRPAPSLTAAGLFAGIGGVELGLASAGIETRLLCEVWEPARAVLARHFPQVPLASDVRDLRALPSVDVVAAGFPCTDLSQAGRMAGITGAHSGLVGQVFRLLDRHPRRQKPTWVVFENVRNMLPLDGGHAMAYLVGELEARGFRWAYRVVDSRFSGVPQRRQRVLLVASRAEDPTQVLFADDAGDPGDFGRDDAYGFYWTEGVRGLGWAKDAVPTLKGGSTLGIPSPPAIWLRHEPLPRRFVTPTISDAERLQGFPTGWTEPAQTPRVNGPRWKLVGNAVTVGVAAWLGRRLVEPGTYDTTGDEPLDPRRPWPDAAWGERGRRCRVRVGMWP
ncbi:MAG TPA: DNA (cytosine-5-)-methyltransferase, partial [Actinopolymorphaceae bacterium]